jgi:hypothetical protein
MEDSRANENDTILKNESYDTFPNQVFMEKKPLIESMGKNRSLQTQSKPINSDEEKMKLKFQKLHVH